MKRIFGILAFCTFGCIAIYSCTHVSGTYVSTHGSFAGRSMEGNCMDCHQRGATQGGFTVAGTVYNSLDSSKYPNCTVFLYKQPRDTNGMYVDSSLVATIEVDGVGNFYTTHPIDLSQGLYARVTSPGGQKSMDSAITNGSCNSCHGSITSKISLY